MQKTILAFVCYLICTSALANNIAVTNTSLSGQNTTSDFYLVNFDIAWDNSWRTSTNENNYDGAWIYIKYRKNNTSDWRHATISSTGNTPGTGAAYFIPADNKGAFIYRSADGIGNVTYTANNLQWNYGVDGLLDNETVEIKVFAVEMVYITAGAFYLGSGGGEANAFREGTTTNPYLVAGTSAITVGTSSGNLDPNGAGVTGSIPSTYPNGFAAFWVMKYECSQQQYVDFLNHLDLARANANNTPGIFTGSHPTFAAPQPERALGSLGFMRTAALADWSALRPYTELEFEKICRGQNTPPVPNEYAWGNTTLVSLTATTNAGISTETVASPANANVNINGAYGVAVRGGLFARASGSSRTLSGGAYYGVMNMSDNFYEVVVTAVNTQGRSFNAGVHGDGYLDASGNSTITLWNDNNVYGIKGSSHTQFISEARVSDRSNVNAFASHPTDNNSSQYGNRMARTAQ